MYFLSIFFFLFIHSSYIFCSSLFICILFISFLPVCTSFWYIWSTLYFLYNLLTLASISVSPSHLTSTYFFLVLKSFFYCHYYFFSVWVPNLVWSSVCFANGIAVDFFFFYITIYTLLWASLIFVVLSFEYDWEIMTPYSQFSHMF